MELGSSVAVLWRRLAAVAQIQPIAWDPPCAVGAALKRPKKKKKREREIEKFNVHLSLEYCHQL